MKVSIQKLWVADLIINVVLPILAGAIIYYAANYFELNKYVRNQLPDGLWAWALFSCTLIIWDRRIHLLWISSTFVLCILFEVLQYFRVIRGVGDYLDVLTYFIFGIAALLVNKYFIITFKYNYANEN